MTQFRAMLIMQDLLEEQKFYCVAMNTGKNAGLFTLVAIRDNYCIPVYIRDITNLESDDRCVSNVMISHCEDFARTGNKSFIFLLTRKGVSLIIVKEEQEATVLQYATKSSVEAKFIDFLPLEKSVEVMIRAVGLPVVTQ